MTAPRCQACGSAHLETFYTQRGVPANSCLLLATETEAVEFPVGRIELAFCGDCGFIANTAFDPALAEYSDRYEETQGFSPRFVKFAGDLARTWVERYDLTGKHVVEIGCGKGEFLTLMAEAGIGSGLGIDPGVDISRIDSPAADRLEWHTGLFDEEFGKLDAAAVVCRHTLEHIPDVRRFLTLIHDSLAESPDTVLLFELPDTMRVLEEGAFWDVYYEHCSYFSMGSLTRLFERCGFEVLDVYRGYDDQYLLIEARPRGDRSATAIGPDDMDRLEDGVSDFVGQTTKAVDHWTSEIEDVGRDGGKTVIWGASSKGVAFLVAVDADIEAAVDINPNKQGMFMAGTGHKILGPHQLLDLAPDLVVVMNPIYIEEITSDLSERGIEAEVTAV